MNHKILIPSISVALVAIVAISLIVTGSFQNVLAGEQKNHTLDFNLYVDNEIHAKRGDKLTIPVTFYGSTKTRDVDVVVTGADLKIGAIHEDTTNPKLPTGFSIELPVKHINIQAMDEKSAREKQLGTVDMKVNVDNAVEPGTYLFAIHMLDNDPTSGGDNIRYFYVYVE
jgi:hypothetical protein